MTVTDNDFLDLQDRFNALKLTVDTLLQNGLNPLLVTPGTLRFGANKMEVGNNGVVFKTNAATPLGSLFWPGEFPSGDPSLVYPRSEIQGFSNNAAQAALYLFAYRSATVYSEIGMFTGIASTPQAFLRANDGTADASATVQVASGVGKFVLGQAYLELAQQASDPSSPTDGDIWYNTTADKLYARINGATVELGAGGSSMPMPPIVGPHTTMPLMGFFQSGTAATLLASTTWQGANEAIYVPVIVTEDCTITKLWVYNGAAVSGNIDVGVYDSSFAKVVSSGSTAQSGTSQIQEFNVADTAITAGLHYIGVALDNTTGTTLTRALSFTVGTAAETGQALGLAVQSSAFALPNPMVPAAYTRSIMPLAGFATRVLVT